MWTEYGAFTASVREEDAFVGAEALKATSAATTLRIRDGETLITDGPFAETKEHLGGFYLVDARDLDHALAIAARIPGAKVGSIEVRPVLEPRDDRF